MLCLHKKWQERLRQEVLKECGMGIPNAEILLTRLALLVSYHIVLL
jgi:hypothetical protein